MTRSFVGFVLSAAILATHASALAQEAPRVKGTRDAKGATISLESGRLRVVQTLTRDTLSLQITEGREVVRFTGDLTGKVVVERGGRRHGFSVRSGGAADQAAVLNLLAGSEALRSFDAVMNTTWGRSAKPAAAFRSAHAMLGLFRGDYQPTTMLAASARQPQVSIVPARRDGPDACWSAYTHDVLGYTYDLEACVAEARDSWFPLHLGWCAYEYNIKTSLAFAWMLDCYSLI